MVQFFTSSEIFIPLSLDGNVVVAGGGSPANG